ncbi:MAG TPA: chromate efflux transporter [Polyangiales bacterium]|nr:chromate efflux transporter [Polyangiales bacterium]
MSQRTSLLELAALFFRLGATAFGGPAAHIAMMRAEVVARRGWLADQEFLDLLGATNLIPGPNSTELAIHIGYARRGFAGLAVAGLAFIVPAMAITWALAWAYVRFGSLPSARWLLYGVQPVILAVVAQAIWGLVPSAARSWPLRVLGALALLAAALGVNELAVLFGTALLAVAASLAQRPQALLLATPLAAQPLVAAAPSALGLFGVFCKIGSVLFGSGYVLLAFLRADLVERLGWLNEQQLLDAVAAGQITPGPVFTTATFIGYVLAGNAGALAATSGIFLPAFVFVALSGPFIPRLRQSAATAAFLDGLNVASLALMALVTFQIGRAALIDLAAFAIALASAVLLIRFKVNSSWLILGGAAVGFALHALR